MSPQDRKKAWFVEGVHLLPDKIKAIEQHYLISLLASRCPGVKAAGDLKTASESRRNHRMGEYVPGVSDERTDVEVWEAYRADIVSELDAAVKIGSEFAVDLAACRKLSIALSQGFYRDDSPLILDAIAEVVSLAGKLERMNTDPQMERSIELFITTNTAWSKIRSDVGCTEDSQKGFENRVRRYFEKTRGKELSSVHTRESGMKPPNRNK